MTRPRPVLLALLGALAVILAVACGGGGSQPRTENGLETAARQAAEAMIKGDYRKAYDAFSKECREQVPFSEFESTTKLGVMFLEAFAGVKFKDFEITKVEVRNFTEDGGEVSITMKPPKALEGFGEGAGEFEPWKWEDGKWVVADCSGLGGGGGLFDGDADGGSSAAPTVPPPGSGPKLGETVDAGSARVTVRAVEDPVRDTVFAPGDGKRYVAFDITIEAARGKVSVSGFDFTVQDEDGFVYDYAIAGREPALKMTDLAQGRQVRGWVTFEVPQDAKLVALYADLDFPRPETLVLDLTRK
ncbi:DUF4352 domain-containing protein [Tepidiforma flava]|uniref:DUF4352 domain-containing protein n=1 Tax=Tepidiforma flava TaxID=3004094 RepID=A0ABY7MBP1_9CHLR|nr:DUF4352 domain-containing protein [Tepidiforma flava]WBL37420.1 DUF4352 domain-containing protein [Tepidiforma flava]